MPQPQLMPGKLGERGPVALNQGPTWPPIGVRRAVQVQNVGEQVESTRGVGTDLTTVEKASISNLAMLGLNPNCMLRLCQDLHLHLYSGLRSTCWSTGGSLSDMCSA